jgi:formyltetrahydrofolate deformylase
MAPHTSVLTLYCPDSSGIVADVATWIGSYGGNIVDAGETRDAENGLFIQRVEFTHDADPDVLRTSFAPLGQRRDMTWAITPREEVSRLAVLVTRDGHCLYDLLGRCATGDLPATIDLVVSNREDLAEAAGRFGIPFRYIPVRGEGPAARSAQEVEVRDALRDVDPHLIVLARYMRVLTPDFVQEFDGRTINIHHSFLPAFVGANAYRQAWERGVKLIGATSHYVTTGLDEGPIIAQDVTQVTHADTPASMARRGRDLESLVLSRAVRAHLEHRVIAYQGRTVVFE